MANLVAFLTGAGISTDSGIPDYRGPQGVWTRDPDAEKLVTIDYYMADPEIRKRSWQMRHDTPALRAEPNSAHFAIAALHDSGVAMRVITQNIDGLHQKAGVPARKVLELHGSARTVVCTQCGDKTTLREAITRLDAGELDPACRICGGILKTATVMFGENLNQRTLLEATTVASACTVMYAVGTSLQVHPAAGLVGVAAEHGAKIVIVNAEPTPYDETADEVVREPIGTALPRLLSQLSDSAGSIDANQ